MKSETERYECSVCAAEIHTEIQHCTQCGSPIEWPSDSEEVVMRTGFENEEELSDFVIRKLQEETDNSIIVDMLVKEGVEREKASHLVAEIYAEALRITEEEQITPASYFPAIQGAVMASIVGGGLWGLIVILTDFEIGFMALGMGFLTGTAVVKFSKGKKGVPFQLIAVVAAIVGIVIGKYVTYYHFLKIFFGEEYGAEAASEISLISVRLFGNFLSDLPLFVDGYDFLWIAFAIYAAWRIPKGIDLKTMPYK